MVRWMYMREADSDIFNIYKSAKLMNRVERERTIMVHAEFQPGLPQIIQIPPAEGASAIHPRSLLSCRILKV